MSPYRGGELVEVVCPRCKKQKLPPLDVAPCPACGGVWVTPFAATEVLSTVDRRPDPLTRWWRVREPCPSCGVKMVLHGEEPGLLQGCDVHGYFIDADTVAHTKLGGGIDHAALERKREDHARVDAEREACEKRASEKAAERAQIARREAELAGVRMVRPADGPPSPEVVAERQAAYLRHALATGIGGGAADLLLRRIAELERRVAELERLR